MIQETETATPHKHNCAIKYMELLRSFGKKIKNWRSWIFYLIFVTPPLLGTILFGYMFFFRNRLSHELIDWAHTGEYFHWIVEAFNLVLLYRLTQVAHNLQEKVSNDEISNQKTNLEKQLKFELFKDFISKIDDCLSKFAETYPNESSKLYLALIAHLADSAKENFSGLIDAEGFEELCDVVYEKATDHTYNKENENLVELTTSINRIKTMLFHQVKLETK